MRVKIKEICEINPKQEVLADESIVSFIGMAQISNDNQFDTSILKKYKDVKKGFSSFKNGDILFAKITPCMENGKGVLIENLYNEIGFGSTEFHVLRVNLEIVSKKYLYWFTKWKTFRLNCEKNMTGSAGQKRVPKNYIENYELNLPKLFVQEKRVKILDCLLEIKQKKLQKLVELENLSKCLFVEMFGDPILNEKKWRMDICKNISTKIGSGSTPKGGEKSYQTKGITFIRSMNVYNNNFYYKDLAFISEEQGRKLSNVEVEREDILLNITGASVARCCIVPENILPARVNQHVSIIRCKKDIVNTIFLCYQFTTKEYQDFLWKLATSNGATREALTKQQEENLKVIIPPIELQNQFAERIKLIEKSKFIVKKNLKLVLSIQNYLFYTN